MATSQALRIVTENLTVQYPPEPSQLQRSGAMISVGGTTLATGAYQYLSNSNGLASILSTAGNYAELQNMNTTFFAQGNVAGVYVLELGAQSTPQDGISALQTWITANPKVFYAYCVPADWDTMPAPADPTVTVTADSTSTLPSGTYYTQIAYLNAGGTIGQLSPVVTSDVATSSADSLVVTSPSSLTGATDYLVYMGTSSSALYLQNGSSGTAIGTNYTQTAPIATTTGTSTTLADLGNQLSGNTAKTFFCVNTSVTNCAAYGTMGANSVWVGYKAAIVAAPSPSAQTGEFTAAVMLYALVSNNPGPANKLAPVQYRFAFGVTPWPATGYQNDLQTLADYGANWIGTGAEGGIAQNCIFKGTTSSLVQISEWYGVDWAGINTDQALANAIINGSNSNPPLEYDQHGINLLAETAQQKIDDAIAFGCLLSGTVSAVPFATYYQQNPGDYPNGIYNGLSCSAVGQAGFLNITFNLNVSGL